MSTDKTDVWIARQWASKALDNVFLNEVPIDGYRAAARHILASTTPPTMDDIAWDDEVHVGLCALYADGDLVRMLGPDPDEEDVIFCHFINFGSPVTGGLSAENLTPLPGTRLDLTPRREPEPESTPEHPGFLETEEDYRNAPEGTVVADAEETPWTKWDDNLWKHVMYQDRGDLGMRERPRQVLRWGWKA